MLNLFIYFLNFFFFIRLIGSIGGIEGDTSDLEDSLRRLFWTIWYKFEIVKLSYNKELFDKIKWI